MGLFYTRQPKRLSGSTRLIETSDIFTDIGVSITYKRLCIKMDLNQITLPCTNYDESVRFYEILGFRLIVDSPPRYARFETLTGTTLSIHASEPTLNRAGVVICFEVDDVDLEVRKLADLGIDFENEPVDQDWLWREAYFRDPAGNRLCIYHAGRNRRFPPWRL